MLWNLRCRHRNIGKNETHGLEPCVQEANLHQHPLHEDCVGLEKVDDGVHDLFFCFYHIGCYELRTNKIHDIVSEVPLTSAWADHPSNQ